MALVDIGNDVWIDEFESCEKLYCDIVKELSERDVNPPGTNKFNALSASVHIHLSQFNIELSQLDDRLKASRNITREEKERRQRLIEDLQSKFVHLTKMYKTSQKVLERHELFGEVSSHEAPDEPLLGIQPTVEQLKEQQRMVVIEQDRGLEALSNIIGRQKNIAMTITNEVATQNNMIDDIGSRMDSVTGGIQHTSSNVMTVSRSDSTWCYWLTIIILFFCIVSLVI